MRFCYCALPAMNSGIDVCRNCSNNRNISSGTLRCIPFVYDEPKKFNIDDREELFCDKEVIEKFDDKGNLIERITKYNKKEINK